HRRKAMNLDQAKALDRKGWHKIADKLKPETRNFIDGKFVEARKGRTFESINPTDNSIICEMARSDASDVDAAVKSARKAFRAGAWSRMAPRDRMAGPYRCAAPLRRQAVHFAVLDVLHVPTPVV